MSDWYADRRNLAAVARYMGERGDSVDDVAYMLEKPEKFADDWRACSGHAARFVEELRKAGEQSRSRSAASKRRIAPPKVGRVIKADNDEADRQDYASRLGRTRATPPAETGVSA